MSLKTGTGKGGKGKKSGVLASGTRNQQTAEKNKKVQRVQKIDAWNTYNLVTAQKLSAEDEKRNAVTTRQFSRTLVNGLKVIMKLEAEFAKLPKSKDGKETGIKLGKKTYTLKDVKRIKKDLFRLLGSELPKFFKATASRKPAVDPRGIARVFSYITSQYKDFIDYAFGAILEGEAPDTLEAADLETVKDYKDQVAKIRDSLSFMSADGNPIIERTMNIALFAACKAMIQTAAQFRLVYQGETVPEISSVVEEIPLKTKSGKPSMTKSGEPKSRSVRQDFLDHPAYASFVDQVKKLAKESERKGASEGKDSLHTFEDGTYGKVQNMSLNSYLAPTLNKALKDPDTYALDEDVKDALELVYSAVKKDASRAKKEKEKVELDESDVLTEEETDILESVNSDKNSISLLNNFFKKEVVEKKATSGASRKK